MVSHLEMLTKVWRHTILRAEHFQHRLIFSILYVLYVSVDVPLRFTPLVFNRVQIQRISLQNIDFVFLYSDLEVCLAHLVENSEAPGRSKQIYTQNLQKAQRYISCRCLVSHE